MSSTPACPECSNTVSLSKHTHAHTHTHTHTTLFYSAMFQQCLQLASLCPVSCWHISMSTIRSVRVSLCRYFLIHCPALTALELLDTVFLSRWTSPSCHWIVNVQIYNSIFLTTLGTWRSCLYWLKSWEKFILNTTVVDQKKGCCFVDFCFQGQ